MSCKYFLVVFILVRRRSHHARSYLKMTQKSHNLAVVSTYVTTPQRKCLKTSLLPQQLSTVSKQSEMKPKIRYYKDVSLCENYVRDFFIAAILPVSVKFNAVSL
jgi:hypothetical protein